MGLRDCGGVVVSGSLLLLLIGLAPGATRAQSVQGIVLDEFTHGPVKAADVVLIGEKGKVVARAMTGDDGRFALSIPKFSGYHLEVNGLGYAPFTTKMFFADSTQEVSAQVSLAPQAIKLEGLEVTATAVERKLRLVGFYKREAKHVGYFIGPEEIHEKVVDRLTDVFYGIPGLHIRRGTDPTDVNKSAVTMPGGESQFVATPSAGGTQGSRGWCFPSVSIDGTIVSHGGRQATTTTTEWQTMVDPADIAAIEVYPTPAGAPVQVLGNDSPCGAILIWTKDR